MNKAIVTIVKSNREKIIVNNVHVTKEVAVAEIVIRTALALNNLTTADIKLVEYTIDGKHVYGIMRQTDGLHTLTPA